jgi:hypothetical protein
MTTLYLSPLLGMRNLYFSCSIWLRIWECIRSGRHFPIFYDRYRYINIKFPVTFVTSSSSYRTPRDDSPCPACEPGGLHCHTVRAESPGCRNKFCDCVKTTFIFIQPFIQWVPVLFSRDKAAGTWSWTELSPPPSDKMKNAYGYTSIYPLPYTFMSWCLIKHRGNFTSYIVVQYQMGRTWKEDVACFMVSLSQHLVGKDWRKPQNIGNDSSCILQSSSDTECVEI